MDNKFVKEQFEIAKKTSHLSETVVMDVKTLDWLIEQVGKVEQLEDEKELFKQALYFVGIDAGVLLREEFEDFKNMKQNK